MDNLRELADKINIDKDFKGLVKTGEPLAEHTTMGVGGAAAFFAVPDTEAAFIHITEKCFESGSLPFILGGGSNVVFPDSTFLRPVLSTEALCGITLSEPEKGSVTDSRSLLLTCGAGTPIKKLTEFCLEHNLWGLENFAGLPGTAGGAVFMNARCYEKQASDVLYSARYMQIASAGSQPVVAEYTMDAGDWAYKKSPFQSMQGSAVILSATFAVTENADSREKLEEICRGFVEDRRKKGHFDFPSSGSVFKNNRTFGRPSGVLIDEAGLKGTECGGAQIAPWHGNFIINRGNAKTSDICQLVSTAQKAVKAKFGFDLEPEIIFASDQTQKSDS